MRTLGDAVGQDAGGNLRDICTALAANGVCDAAVWPYDIAKFADKPPQAAYENAGIDNDKICTYYRVSGIDQIRQVLSAGHTSLGGIRVYENFEAQTTLQTGIIPAPRGVTLYHFPIFFIDMLIYYLTLNLIFGGRIYGFAYRDCYCSAKCSCI
ncbi:hypothetical protein [Ethanoligenens sp.]|uniref:hypothetical protein n=1 Tax=Ethanoligenens sp. TaxID=2099655 RepID=UPI0039E7E15F